MDTRPHPSGDYNVQLEDGNVNPLDLDIAEALRDEPPDDLVEPAHVPSSSASRSQPPSSPATSGSPQSVPRPSGAKPPPLPGKK
jgi:hypothetical protein